MFRSKSASVSSRTRLNIAPPIDYGSMGISLVPRLGTCDGSEAAKREEEHRRKSERRPPLTMRDEKAKILAKIDKAAKSGTPQPLLLEYVLDTDSEGDKWFVIRNETALSRYFSGRERVGQEELLDMHRVCLDLREADPEYLRILYVIVNAMTEDRKAFYISAERQLVSLRSPDKWIDRAVTGIVGPVERTFVFYRLFYNHLETERLKKVDEAEIRQRRNLQLLQPVPVPTAPFTTIRPVFCAISESEEDNMAASEDPEDGSAQSATTATSPIISRPPQSAPSEKKEKKSFIRTKFGKKAKEKKGDAPEESSEGVTSASSETLEEQSDVGMRRKKSLSSKRSGSSKK